MEQNENVILGFAERWCSKTQSFVFPWGESTVTLEDVMILGGYPVVGNCLLNLLGSRHSWMWEADYFAKSRNHQSGKEKSSLSKGKTAQTGNRKTTIVPWREVINKTDHTETRGGKSQSSVAGASSSKSKHDSSTSKGMERSIRGSTPPQRQRERKFSLTKIATYNRTCLTA